MLFQEHMLKFSACYEFVPGYYLIALDYQAYSIILIMYSQISYFHILGQGLLRT